MGLLTANPTNETCSLVVSGRLRIRVEPLRGLFELRARELSIFCFAYGILPTLATLWLPILLLLGIFTALGVGLCFRR